MLVDDEAIITMQLEKRLSSMGYEVVGVASSGIESVDMARKLRPDLVLMDIVMPGPVDGIDAASRIRAELDIPIIFLTAFADETNISRAKDAEPFGYIVKPFHEKEIQASIEVALHKRAGEQRLREKQNLYHTIMREAFDPIIITDVSGKILEVNERAEHLLGYRRKKLLGTDLNQYLVSDGGKQSKRVRRGNGADTLQEGKVFTGSGADVKVYLSVSDVSFNGRDGMLQILSETDPHKFGEIGLKRFFQLLSLGKMRRPAGAPSTNDTASKMAHRSSKDGGGVPICGSCKKIRVSSTHWIAFESFFGDMYGIDFSHGICSECAHKLWPDMPPDVADRMES